MNFLITWPLAVCLAIAAIAAAKSYAQELYRYNDFESYSEGTSDVEYWMEQTCINDPCAGCGVIPFTVTSELFRAGSQSVRLMKVDDDAGGGGNQYGSIKSYDRDRNGQFLYRVEGLGDVGNVELDTWTDFVVHIYYCTGSDGLVEVWKNDTRYSRRIALPAKDRCYLAFDIYSDRMDPQSPAKVVCFDEIRFMKDQVDTDHFKDVMPAPDTLLFVRNRYLYPDQAAARPYFYFDEGYICVKADHSRPEAEIRVYSLSGTLLDTEIITDVEARIHWEHPPGIYLIRVTDYYREIHTYHKIIFHEIQQKTIF